MAKEPRKEDQKDKKSVISDKKSIISDKKQSVKQAREAKEPAKEQAKMESLDLQSFLTAEELIQAPDFATQKRKMSITKTMRMAVVKDGSAIGKGKDLLS